MGVTWGLLPALGGRGDGIVPRAGRARPTQWAIGRKYSLPRFNGHRVRSVSAELIKLIRIFYRIELKNPNKLQLEFVFTLKGK